jgi:hypothetical protein
VHGLGELGAVGRLEEVPRGARVDEGVDVLVVVVEREDEDADLRL